MSKTHQDKKQGDGKSKTNDDKQLLTATIRRLAFVANNRNQQLAWALNARGEKASNTSAPHMQKME